MKSLKTLFPARYTQASILISCGGLLFGLDTGSIGPVTVMPQFTSQFGSLTSTQHGALVSSILITGAIASFFGGRLADVLGRGRAVSLGGFIFGIGAALEAAAMHIAMFAVGRVIAGVGEGVFLSTMVVYVCEISPPSKRGTLASVAQFFITASICVGYFVCYRSVKIESSWAWRVPFVLMAAVAFLYSISALLFLPYSPRWLTLVGRKEEAMALWEKLEVPADEREKEEHMNDGMNKVESRISARPVSIKEKGAELLAVFGKDVRKRTALGVFLMGMQQLSGIDGVLYYAPLLFKQAGLESSEASFLASGVTALVIFGVTIPGSLFADSWGRRTSTIVGGFGGAISMIVIGALYASDSVQPASGAGRWVVIVMIYVFCASFSCTWAIAIKIYASEVQPPKTRAAATSLSQSVNWIVNWLVAFTTPIFLANSSSGVYFMFGACNLLTGVVCLAIMPETKGRSLEEIDEAFHLKRSDTAKGTRKSRVLSLLRC